MPAFGQEEGSQQYSVYIELLGNAGAYAPLDEVFSPSGSSPFSINYEMYQAGGWGLRGGASTDISDPASDGVSVFVTAKRFFEVSSLTAEVGAGPLFRLEDVPRLAVTGTVGLRFSPLFGRYLLRLSYAPTMTSEGYVGYPGLSFGMEL